MEKLLKNSLNFRLLTSIVFVPFFLALFDYHSIPLLLFVLGLVGVLSYEFFQILRQKGLEPYFKLGVFSSILITLTMFVANADNRIIYFILTFIIIILSVNELTRKHNKKFILHISSTVFGIMYIGWMAGHILLISKLSVNYFNSSVLLYFSFFMIWLSDTFAFFSGILLGKHKLIPRISPSKTYEGLIGGLILSILSGILFRIIWAPFLNIIDIIIIGIIATIGGLSGDLVESAMKRDADLKDVSNILPGHGGVLDRFDSILFALPLLYYYYVFILIPRFI